jgi:hypothetical protein
VTPNKTKDNLPGEKCSVAGDCLGTCTNSVWVGLPEGSTCTLDAECDVGLYCNQTMPKVYKWNALKKTGDKCDESKLALVRLPWMGNNIWVNNTCTLLQSIAVGSPALHYLTWKKYSIGLDAATGVFKCIDPPNLTGGKVDWNIGDMCIYSDGMKLPCRCAVTNAHKGRCFIGLDKV